MKLTTSSKTTVKQTSKLFFNLTTAIALWFSFLSVSFAGSTDIGIQVGPSLTKSIGKNAINSKVDIGAAAEFFLRYNISNMVSIRSGVGFADKGDRYNGITYTNKEGNQVLASVSHHRTKYITIPLLVELTFGNKKVQPYVNTGLYFGFLLNARDVFKDNTNGNIFKRTVTNDYHVFDMGYVLGVGLKVPIKTHWLFDFGVRNNFGFLQTNKNSNAYVHKLLNYSSDFNFGFAYRIGGN